jgi:hypothetical protein
MRQARRRVRPLLVSAALLVLAGCSSDSEPPAAPPSAPAGATTSSPGGGPTSSGPTSSGTAGGETEGAQPKACSVVTQAEARAALGQPVGPGKDADLGVFSSCVFTATAGRSAVTVQVLRNGTTATAFDQLVSGQGGGPVRQIPGVGDKAVQVAGILLFLKGSTIATVLVLREGTTPGANDAAEVTLATTIAGRI